MEHTPTPWSVSKGFGEKTDIYVDLDTHYEEMIASTFSDVFPHAVAEANAAFIVRAANAYEIFREALRRISVTDSSTVENYSEWVEGLAKQAIADAEGK